MASICGEFKDIVSSEGVARTTARMMLLVGGASRATSLMLQARRTVPLLFHRAGETQYAEPMNGSYQI